MNIDTEVPDQKSSDDALPEPDNLNEQETAEGPIDDSEDQSAEDAEENPRADDSPETAPDDVADEPEDSAEQPQDHAAAELEDDDSIESSESALNDEAEFPEYDDISDDEMKLQEDDSSEENDVQAAEETAEQDDATEEKPVAAASKPDVDQKKNGNFTKLAFSAIITCGLIIVVLVYTKQFSFLKTDTTRQPVATVPEAKQVESSPAIKSAKKTDPYAKYRTKLSEAAQLRESILVKRQEIQRLKVDYAEGIEKLENDILVEILDYNLSNFDQALENKRVELGLKTIQRRQAYIQKLDDPLDWLELGSEKLLYLKRRAAVDLQLIEIAGNIDMDMHVRHINAAIQKYQLTADNLAIDPETVEVEHTRKIWQRLYLKTKNNPLLRAELNNWYIQREVCSGNLSRIGELSEITTETVRCVSELDAVDLFLNNITELSPSSAKYLCQWNGKWLCLNGVNTLSPSVAEYLFQWTGEWISLNGLSEFPPDRAKHLIHWEGKQLELMGLQENFKKTDRQTLTYLVEWEKAGGKLFVPQYIRNLMDQL